MFFPRPVVYASIRPPHRGSRTAGQWRRAAGGSSPLWTMHFNPRRSIRPPIPPLPAVTDRGYVSPRMLTGSQPVQMLTARGGGGLLVVARNFRNDGGWASIVCVFGWCNGKPGFGGCVVSRGTFVPRIPYSSCSPPPLLWARGRAPSAASAFRRRSESGTRRRASRERVAPNVCPHPPLPFLEPGVPLGTQDPAERVPLWPRPSVWHLWSCDICQARSGLEPRGREGPRTHTRRRWAIERLHSLSGETPNPQSPHGRLPIAFSKEPRLTPAAIDPPRTP